MPVPGIATTATPPLSLQQLSPSAGHHKHNGGNTPSVSDIGGQSSTPTPPSNSTGRIGSVLDIRI
ncbi:MAG: hypothetical protein WA889_09405 [Xanthobacteraceae bacterium]